MKLENAKVTVTLEDPNELIEAMTPEEKTHFLQSLSTHDEVLEFVMQQVFHPCTDDGYSGSEIMSWNGNTPLQVFRNKMIGVGADDAANRRINDLERYMELADNRINELEEELDSLKWSDKGRQCQNNPFLFRWIVK